MLTPWIYSIDFTAILCEDLKGAQCAPQVPSRSSTTILSAFAQQSPKSLKARPLLGLACRYEPLRTTNNAAKLDFGGVEDVKTNGYGKGAQW